MLLHGGASLQMVDEQRRAPVDACEGVSGQYVRKVAKRRQAQSLAGVAVQHRAYALPPG
jgi:hypothetical protein